MNLFWQISAVEFFLNISVFVIAIVAYEPALTVEGWCMRATGTCIPKGLATGVLFGAATGIAILVPVHLENSGAAATAQALLVALAAPLGGALAGLIAFSLAILALFLKDGGVDNTLSIASLTFGAVGGAVVWWQVRRQERPLSHLHLLLLGCSAGLGGVLALVEQTGGMLDADKVSPDLLPDLLVSIVVALGSSIIATFALGTLLLREDRRLSGARELRESEGRYRLLAENATDVIARFDRDRHIEYLSPAASEVLGCAPERFVGQGANLLVHPADWPLFDDALATLGHCHQTTVTHRVVRLDDQREVWIETSLRRVNPLHGFRSTGKEEGEIVGVLREISARRKAEEALRLANQAKSDFLAAMSHELRTPLNAVIGFAEMIRRQMVGPVGQAKYIEYASDIKDSGEHLLGLINDILDFSKVEAGEMVLSMTEVSLDTVVGSSVRMIRTRADHAHVKLEAADLSTLPTILGDERRLTQIVLNILSNAVKFTPADGHVRVAAHTAADGAISIDVSDTGIGIAPEHMEAVLIPFRQVEGGWTRSHEGTGLGLPLTKRLVEMHGGQLTIASTLGQGTTVTVTFPPSPHVLAAA